MDTPRGLAACAQGVHTVVNSLPSKFEFKKKKNIH